MKTTTSDLEEEGRLQTGEDPEAPPETSVADGRREELRRADHEEIALLAYRYWCERGHPDGSPEEDWFKAEHALRERKQPEREEATPGGTNDRIAA
jgi:hypothetical protein